LILLGNPKWGPIWWLAYYIPRLSRASLCVSWAFLFVYGKNGIHSVQRDEVPEIRDFTRPNNYWLGESGKAILQVSVAVFFRVLSKYFFGQRWLSPLAKNTPLIIIRP